jgi:hypothetical protein
MITGYSFPDLTILEQNASSFREWIDDIKIRKEQLKGFVKEWTELDNQSKAAPAEDKERINEAKKEAIKKVKDIQQSGSTELQYNPDFLFAILNAYKAMNAFDEAELLLTPIVEGINSDNNQLKQQLALVLNKQKKRTEAEKILNALIDQYGPDPETNGLLGSVYKGMMDHSTDDIMKEQYAMQSIDAYLAGFGADPRDYYPGVNALTLMYLNTEGDERFNKYYPLVSYAVERQLVAKEKNYWVHATGMELAALQLDNIKVKKFLGAAIACNPADWEKKTTAANLRKIYARALPGSSEEKLKWLNDVILYLSK